ncbi:MAG: galactose-1-phosphate uridylyltransferase [Nitrospirae bacterium]|nr:galactose-1-phosphate uridylyltransferase [Nitrospirota bacterium]
MPELRLNMITREWVIVAKDKLKKPENFIKPDGKRKHPAYLDICPFCPGNEEKSPGEVYRIHDESGWKIRAILNKFSILSQNGERQRVNTGLKKSVNGVGIHEVVIDTPFHNQIMATMTVDHLKEVVQTFKERMFALYEDPRVEYVIIFKNSGHDSGTPVEHSISQIVGMPITPLEVRARTENQMRFFDDTGECLLCKTLSDELNDGLRVVCNTDHFLSFVPYAALSPFHLWVFPKRHSGTFTGIRSDEMWDLALNLKTTMAKVYYGLENPDFNFVLRSGRPSNCDSEYMHWYISLVPRVSTLTGFELGTGMFINPLAPEESANFLRRVRIPEHAV